MAKRHISDALLCDLLEKGQTRYKDSKRLWIALNYADRNDNLICAAVVLEEKLVVKTVMHPFCWESSQ